jgi:DNA-binding CsgD family transcriptional regulator
MQKERRGLAFMEKRVVRPREAANPNQLPLLSVIEARPRATAVNRIRALVAKEIFEGSGIEAVKAKLSRTEQSVLDGYVLAEDRPKLKQAAERLGMPEGTVSSSVTSIRYKLAGKYEHSLGKKRQSERIKRIKDIFRQRIRRGERFNDIKPMFSEREMKVFELSIISGENLTQWEVAERLRISPSSVSSALARIEEKLNVKTVQLHMRF